MTVFQEHDRGCPSSTTAVLALDGRVQTSVTTLISQLALVFHLARGVFGLEIIHWNYIANIEAFRGLSTSTDPFH